MVTYLKVLRDRYAHPWEMVFLSPPDSFDILKCNTGFHGWWRDSPCHWTTHIFPEINQERGSFCIGILLSFVCCPLKYTTVFPVYCEAPCVHSPSEEVKPWVILPSIHILISLCDKSPIILHTCNLSLLVCTGSNSLTNKYRRSYVGWVLKTTKYFFFF